MNKNCWVWSKDLKQKILPLIVLFILFRLYTIFFIITMTCKRISSEIHESIISLILQPNVTEKFHPTFCLSFSKKTSIPAWVNDKAVFCKSLFHTWPFSRWFIHEFSHGLEAFQSIETEERIFILSKSNTSCYPITPVILRGRKFAPTGQISENPTTPT